MIRLSKRTENETTGRRIKSEMKKILESFPGGLKYAELVRRISEALPDEIEGNCMAYKEGN